MSPLFSLPAYQACAKTLSGLQSQKKALTSLWLSANNVLDKPSPSGLPDEFDTATELEASQTATLSAKVLAMQLASAEQLLAAQRLMAVVERKESELEARIQSCKRELEALGCGLVQEKLGFTRGQRLTPTFNSDKSFVYEAVRVLDHDDSWVTVSLQGPLLKKNGEPGRLHHQVTYTLRFLGEEPTSSVLTGPALASNACSVA